ncbi:MAG: winged helix-turn-helix domain-containing protein [Acidobacteria bacterium]|nr:winged helix-turn-helix domain-containing protein [Acidobacteriota bacterium]
MSLLINHFYRFGEFTLDTDQKVLLRAGKPVSLTPKVFDMLLVLVENAGRIVSKEDLMRRVWPDTYVEESNLTTNIKELRKALGDEARRPRYVETVARRGYRFIADVEEVLREGGAPGDRVTRRFETTEHAPPRRAAADNGHAPSPDAARQPYTRAAPEQPDAPAAARAARARKLTFALAAALVAVALVGAALREWSGGGGGDANGRARAGDESAAALPPLRFEKLTGAGESQHVALSPDGKFVAYTRGFGRAQGIWLRQLATDTNVEIVPATEPVFGLAFTHGGDYLYFVGGAPTALYRVSPLGGAPTKIVERLEGRFSVSPDDRRLAFVRRGVGGAGLFDYSLVVADADGRNERALLVEPHPNKLDAPLWTQDGAGVVCADGNTDGGGEDVRVVEVNAADGARRELSPERFWHVKQAAWLPRGRGLIMSAAKKAGDYNQLWRLAYPGAALTQVTEGVVSYDDVSVAADAGTLAASQTTRLSNLWVGASGAARDPRRIAEALDNFCWTPGGELVYASAASGRDDLWLMRPDGAQQRQLTANAASNAAPAVSPDGRYVVFVSNRTGRFQVWRMNADGGDQVQLTDGAAKNYPAVSPDGRWVFYNTVDDWNLWKVSVDGGEPVRLTDYVAARPAVSPDGAVIACVGREGGRRTLLFVPIAGGAPSRKLTFGELPSRLQWTPDGGAVLYATQQGGANALVRQTLDGGAPETIASFDADDDLYDFGYSPDGGSLAVVRGGWQHDIVLTSEPAR